MRVSAMVELIDRKKAGGEMSKDELAWVVSEYARGTLPDYQVAAWLMAVCWRGMTSRETGWLTAGLVASGATLEWPSDRPVVDKHSTGGVGDKVSIVLVPLLASAGLTFVKMSGRGLGHTGGTVDKLESIPGYRTALTLEEIRRQVDRIGCALVAQSPELVPADGALYALRDATGAVDSAPLIASSIMAKKLASGARAIVLDVKFGVGAFMRSQADAEVLARLMVEIGEAAGRRVRAIVNAMDEPLGNAVGNALEIREAIEALKGGGPADLRAMVMDLGAHLMVLSGAATSHLDASRALGRLLDSGVAADHFVRLIEAQGGDPLVVADPSRLPTASCIVVVASPSAGLVTGIDARAVAEAALALGAGRRQKGDSIDPAVGVRVLAKKGQLVEQGEPVAEVHAAFPDDVREAAVRLLRAISVSADGGRVAPSAAPVVVGSA